MQVAAAFPRYVRRDEVDPAELVREREIFRGQAAGTGKPAQVIEKIVDGKIEKFYVTSAFSSRSTCAIRSSPSRSCLRSRVAS